jgi:hypothetical protein
MMHSSDDDSGEALLESRRVDPNSQDLLGRTPISYAASWGNYFAVNMLLRYGAEPDMKDNMGRTALWWNKYAYKRHDRQSTDPIDTYDGVDVDVDAEYDYSDYSSDLSHILW